MTAIVKPQSEMHPTCRVSMTLFCLYVGRSIGEQRHTAHRETLRGCTMPTPYLADRQICK